MDERVSHALKIAAALDANANIANINSSMNIKMNLPTLPSSRNKCAKTSMRLRRGLQINAEVFVSNFTLY